MHNRAARVAPKAGKWEAYFADTPHVRCLGATPREALANLRTHAANCAKEKIAQKNVSAESRRKRNVLIFAGSFLVCLLVTAFIVQATANVGRTPRKIYAHHRLHHRHRQDR